MNASLPTLPVPSTGLDTATLPQGEGTVNQELASTGVQFGPLLQQAVGALGEPPVAPPEGLEALPQPAQVLPPEGKLLPLLQQVLDAASAEGLDPDTVLENIREKLETVSADPDLEPTQAVAIAIQQFIDENPQLAASIESGLQRNLPAGGVQAIVADSDLPVHRQVQQVLSGTAEQTAREARLPEAAAYSDQRNPAGQGRPGTGLIPLNLARQEADSRHEAAALFSRLVAESRSTSGIPEALPRNDSLLGTLGSLTSAQPATPATQASPGMQNFTLNTPFNQAGWDKALGERLQWMAGQGIQRASIKLNPAHLGPMEVRIQVQNDQANVQFTSAHTVVRDALEASLPRLREMFDNAGVELADVDVSGQSFAEQQQAATDGRQGGGRQGGSGVFDVEGEAEIPHEIPLSSLPASGRLDLFA